MLGALSLAAVACTQSTGGKGGDSSPAPTAGSSSHSAGGLAQNFQSPPDSARPWVYWFWLNGNITKEGITADLEAMKLQGITGVLLFDAGVGGTNSPKGPVFMSLIEGTFGKDLTTRTFATVRKVVAAAEG